MLGFTWFPASRCVDLEFIAQVVAGGIELLAVNSPAAISVRVAVLALPDDGEVAAGVGGHAGIHLVAQGGRTDLELIPDLIAVGIELFAKNAPAVAVLVLARPGDDKSIGGIHRHRKDSLGRRPCWS